MEDRVKWFKGALAAAGAALTALWGWFGWLVLAWGTSMVLDVLTGMAAGCARGEWRSQTAREGLWHKAGCIAAVTAAGVLDLVAGLLTRQLPPGTLPFPYTVFLCPLAVMWYLLTEVGSILENVGEMGAPIPSWLRRAVWALRDKVDEKGGEE